MDIPKPAKSLEETIREQKGRPLSFEEMLGPAGGDEERENVDAFLTMLREMDVPQGQRIRNGSVPLVPVQ